MRAGQLRHRLRIEEVVETRSDSGDVDESWNEFDTVWGSLEAVTGNERFRAEREHAEVTHLARIRHLDGVTPKMRITHDGRTFDIEAVYDPEGRKREMHILTREAV